MPELPDIQAYLTGLLHHVVGKKLAKIRLASPFVLRSVDPPVSELEGKTVTGVRRIGKRIVWELEADLFVVIHFDDRGSNPVETSGH